jgi:hypothetical protein
MNIMIMTAIMVSYEPYMLEIMLLIQHSMRANKPFIFNNMSFYHTILRRGFNFR